MEGDLYNRRNVCVPVLRNIQSAFDVAMMMNSRARIFGDDLIFGLF